MSAFAGLRARWAGLELRERRMVALAAAIVATFLLWTLGLAPALRTLQTAPAQIDRLDHELAAMRQQAAQAASWRGAPRVPREAAVAALQVAAGRLGEAAKLSVQGERATLAVNGIGAGALRDFLAEARSGARARPLEASLSRSGSGYMGTLVLALPAAEGAP